MRTGKDKRLGTDAGPELSRLKSTVDRLRAPGGCPWDQEQTAESLLSYLLEEAHEVAEAVREEDAALLREELGDLLLNVFLQVRIAEEQASFDLADVARDITAKIVRRHPHVFGASQGADPETLRKSWQAIKASERRENNKPVPPESALSHLPLSMSALLRAQRLGEDAARVGFDWPDGRGPVAKIREELEEVEQAVAEADPGRIQSEIGDLLLAVTSLCRHSGVDGESALNAAMLRFRSRFEHMEANTRDLMRLELKSLEALWQEAKQAESATDG